MHLGTQVSLSILSFWGFFLDSSSLWAKSEIKSLRWEGETTVLMLHSLWDVTGCLLLSLWGLWPLPWRMPPNLPPQPLCLCRAKVFPALISLSPSGWAPDSPRIYIFICILLFQIDKKVCQQSLFIAWQNVGHVPKVNWVWHSALAPAGCLSCCPMWLSCPPSTTGAADPDTCGQGPWSLIWL